MGDIPFEKFIGFIGFIVFAIIAGAQVWMKYRSSRKGQPPPREVETSETWEPAQAPKGRRTPEEELRDFMEALGVPTTNAPPPLPPPRPAPVAPPKPRPAPVLRREVPPPVVRRPVAPPTRPVMPEVFEPQGGMEDIDPGRLVTVKPDEHLFTTQAEVEQGASYSGTHADEFMRSSWAEALPQEPALTAVADTESGRRTVDLVKVLQDRTRLQTVLVLSEVLGPPRALRGY